MSAPTHSLSADALPTISTTEGRTMDAQHTATREAVDAIHDTQDARRARQALEALAAYEPPKLGQTIACETVTGWASEYDRRAVDGKPRRVWLTIEDRRDGGREVADVRAWVELGMWGIIVDAAADLATAGTGSEGLEDLRLARKILEAAGIVDGAVSRQMVERLTLDGIDRIRVDDDGRALVPLHLAMFPRARDPRAVSWRALANVIAYTARGAQGVSRQHYATLRGMYGDRLDVSARAQDAAESEILEAVREHAPHVLTERTAAETVEIHAARVASSMAHDARHALTGGNFAVSRVLPNGGPSEGYAIPGDADMRRRAVALLLEDDDVRAAVVDALQARGVAVGGEL